MEPICYKAIEAVLKDKMYNPVHVTPWVDEICSRVTKDLIDMNKPFKYLGMNHYFFFLSSFSINVTSEW